MDIARYKDHLIDPPYTDSIMANKINTEMKQNG